MTVSNNAYELDQFPQDHVSKARESNLPQDELSLLRDRQEIAVEGFPLVQISLINSEDSLIQEGSSKESELRRKLEKEVLWTMEEGDEFVCMETFTEVNEALILLDVLKKYNVPSIVSFLARREDGVAISYSRIQIDLDCLVFCLFSG